RIVVKPTGELALRLRRAQLPDQLALRHGEAALGDSSREIVSQAGKGVVPEQLPERLRRLAFDFRGHTGNIPAWSMVYSCESFNDRDKHWRQRHGVCSLLDESDSSKGSDRGWPGDRSGRHLAIHRGRRPG